MASDLSKAQFRGLLIPDPRLGAVWTAESSFNQADPQPGVPAAQGSYDMSLTASGEQAAAGQMRIQTLIPGHPSKSGPGAFVWRNSGDTYWRGWDVPNVITNFQSVIWTDGTAVTIAAKTPSVVTMDDGTVVTAFYRETASAHQVRVRVMASSADTFASGVTVYSQSDAPSAKINDGFYPCLLKLPGDRLLLYFLTEAGDLGNVRAYQSTDRGASWTLAALSVLAEPVSLGTVASSGVTTFTTRRLRAAHGGGQVLLVLETISNDTDYTNRHLYKQYASDSAGLVFAKIEDGPTSTGTFSSLAGAEFLVQFDVAYHASGFLVSFVPYNKISIIRLGSAYQKISSGTVASSPASAILYVSLSSGLFYGSVGNQAMTISDDGRIYIFADGLYSLGTYRYGACFSSVDDGATIDDLGAASLISPDGALVGPGGVWWNSGADDDYPAAYSTTFARGRVLMMANHVANPGNEDDSLHMLTLGGSSTVTMPTLTGYMAETRRGGFTETWLPFDLPGATGTWTATMTGTETLDNGQVELLTWVAQDAYYAATFAALLDYTNGFVVRFSLICTHGSVLNDACAVRMRLAQGFEDWDISVRFKSDSFRLYDNNAGAAVGADVPLDMSTRREFLVAFASGTSGANDGAAQIWYRTKDSSSDRVWTQSRSSTTLTNDTSTPAASSYIQWGHYGNPADSQWDEFHVCRGASAGDNIATQTNPDDLWAKPYAPSGYRSHVNSGLFITAHDGPARLADSYNIDTRYGFPIDRIFFSESQSPRVKWRSADETEQTIALALDQTLLGTDDSQPGNDVIGLALMGINWKTGELQGYDSGTSSWVTISTIDTASGLSSLGWIRDGNTIRPSAGSAGSQYLQQHEFAGGFFGLNALAGSPPLRKIQTNTAGLWSGSTTQKLPTILLEDVEAADRASGTLGYICPPNICVIAKLNGSKYAGYRLKIDAQDTVEGYFTVGSMVLGWVSAFGRSYSRGRIIETAANTSIVDRTDGTTTSKNHGPAARTVQISWTDGVDVSAVHGSSPDPDYIKGSTSGSAQAIASIADVPYQIEGVVRMLEGPNKPVIYLPSVDKTGDTIILNRRQQFVTGRLTEPARLENVLGDELQDPGEVFRVASVNIREIV